MLSADPDQRPSAKNALKYFDWFLEEGEIINNLLSLNDQFSCKKDS
jgi:hypothetical protein